MNQWMEKKEFQTIDIPLEDFRRHFHVVATSSIFFGLINVVIVLNLAETIASWVLIPTTDTTNPTKDADQNQLIFAWANTIFTAFYTAEVMIKIVGLSWAVYWANSWFSWNRFELLLLILSYVELIMDVLVIFGATTGMDHHFLPTSALRIFIFFRLIRFGRTVRLLRPILLRIFQFLDSQINAHLFLAYDVAKAFIVAQEECLMMISNIISYKPLASQFKSHADTDCRAIIKEVGLLNEKKPDVAAAVKTRQAIRLVLNRLKKSVEHMKNQGILDEDEVEHLEMTIQERLKRLHHFPHSVALTKPMERLWNVTWVSGNQEVFDVLKLLFEERKYETAAQLISYNEEADGVYVVVNGVVSVTYPRVYTDNPELGEIYNSDNLIIGVEEGYEGRQRHDYVLPGGLLNEQSMALDFPRRSHVACDTPVSVLYIDVEVLFRAMAALPFLEAKFWKRVATCVALNILIKIGNLQDSTLETEKSRLSRGAVRLIHPGTKVIGLDEFEEAFLITGTLTDTTSAQHNSLIGPMKIPSTCREAEVREGRHSVTSQNGEVIYPEYSIFLLVPSSGRDLSGFNLHDSQTSLLEWPSTNPQSLRNMLYATLTTKLGTTPTDVQIMQTMHDVAASINCPHRQTTITNVSDRREARQ